jgi:radical SAM superfamily enzyme YgiQ (UPF0313 family)
LPDLNLIADRNYAAELFEALIPLNLKWAGLTTSLLARDDALLDLCARSGCIGLLVGFESITHSGLKGMQKGFNSPELYAEWIEKFHSAGIAVNGTFVFGIDDHTPDVFEETAQFVIDAGIDLPRFAILTPFPGTALFKRLEAEDRITNRNWELYDGQHVVFEPAQMSADALQQGNMATWRRVYGYRSIAQRMRATPVSKLMFLGANMGYRFYANRLDQFYTCDWRLMTSPSLLRSQEGVR